ncbi:hypothetical protein LUZ61_015561 [Rhynchospora tenuis]|uniref:Hexosyltransferase n=1 Tax=Rhynchospora tenuis TaxID=198213 RepID=A0AAD5Z3V1_9POAL|nr:hypothetical protein LUZ61_015561 [Rhynchospora tenuis]
MVVNSVIRNAADPSRYVFHVVTDPMYLPTMQTPTSGAHVGLHSTTEYTFLNASYSPVIRQIETGKQELSLLHYLRFYLPENEDGLLWKPDTVLSAGLMTFYTTTRPLEKSWHVMGLGYNPSVSHEEIRKAVVLHFNGNMKPWLDVAMNQYKLLWTKYVDSDM